LKVLHDPATLQEMGVTPVDLYRAGNSTGPRMDRVRPTDIVVIQQHGVDWVNPQQGGVSTREAIYWPSRHWWRILQGTSFTDFLVLRKDHGDHWLWEPARGMEFAEYVRLLATLNKEFMHV
jgi:hypothetical protein